MDLSIELVTPETAAKWLENNPQNRNIKRSHVERITRDMKSGRWQVNGDAIRFNGDGSLIDGQHRLTACVAADVPFQTVVIRNLDSAARKTIDDGARRSHGDRLGMQGVIYGNIVSATVKAISNIARGSMSETNTPSELDDILGVNPGVHESAAKVGSLRNIGSKSMAAAYHYIIAQISDIETADAFLKVWSTGVPEYDGDPVQKFRMRDMQLKAIGRAMNRKEYHRTLGRAVDAFIIQEPLSRLTMKKEPGVKGWDMEKLMASK